MAHMIKSCHCDHGDASSRFIHNVNESCHIWMGCLTYTNEACHVWLSRVTGIIVMRHQGSFMLWTSHVTYEWAVLYIRMRRVTYNWVVSQGSRWCVVPVHSHCSWWVLQHCTGVARLVWGRLRVHRAFVYSDWFVSRFIHSEQVMSYMLMCHAYRRDKAHVRHMDEWVMVLINESYHRDAGNTSSWFIHVRMSHGTCINESWQTWMSHITGMMAMPVSSTPHYSVICNTP